MDTCDGASLLVSSATYVIFINTWLLFYQILWTEQYPAVMGCHRRSFANPVKLQWSTTESVRLLMGTNKAAWGVKLLLTTISSYQVNCGSFRALLKTQHCCLPPCGWYFPPSASHPPPTPTPPPPACHPL